MSNLILSSNYIGNKLEGVGQATLDSDEISIVALPMTIATLLRGANKVMLTQLKNEEQIISGKVVLGDVYLLENNDKKITFKVEGQKINHETDIYINNENLLDATSTKRKTTLSIGVIILVLLILSVVFGVKQKKISEFNQISEERLNKAIEYYEIGDRESFVLAKEIAEKLKLDGYQNSKLDELVLKIMDSESEVLGEVKVDIKELLDLTLQISGFKGDMLSSSGETVFVFDKDGKNVLQMDVNGKNAKIKATGDDLKDTKKIASYQDNLFLDKLDDVYRVEDDSMFYVYAGNIYEVSKSENRIFRYSGSGKTFAPKSDWLAPGIEMDFSKSIDMAIDGSIWLLSSTGKVTKLTNGNPISVSMEGIVSPLTHPTSIYTNETLKYVYILDMENGRVVVLEKNGQFKLQYVNDKIKEANDLVVSEKEGKIILLTGSKLIYLEPKKS